MRPPKPHEFDIAQPDPRAGLIVGREVGGSTTTRYIRHPPVYVSVISAGLLLKDGLRKATSAPADKPHLVQKWRLPQPQSGRAQLRRQLGSPCRNRYPAGARTAAACRARCRAVVRRGARIGRPKRDCRQQQHGRGDRKSKQVTPLHKSSSLWKNAGKTYLRQSSAIAIATKRGLDRVRFFKLRRIQGAAHAAISFNPAQL